MEIAGYCSRFNVLPRPGGMMQQYPREMARIAKMLHVLDEYEAEEAKKETK